MTAADDLLPKLGRRAPTGAPALRLSAVLSGKVPDHPVQLDYLGPAGWQMLGNNQYGDCVTPETRILTADLRWLPASDLAVGDSLLTFTEQPVAATIDGAKSKGRYYEPAVVECVDRVTRPTYELEFDDGTVVRSSSGHKWLCGSLANGARWVETQNLKAGGVNASTVGKPLDVWDTDNTYEAGYLAAALDGEGNLDQQDTTQRVMFSQVGNAMLDQVEQSLKALDIDYTHTVDQRSTRTYDGPRQDVHRLAVGKRAHFLRLMGSVRPARLLPKLDIAKLGRLDRTGTARLVRKTFLGDREVVMLNTTSGTYFAEGLTSHNCVAVTWANLRRIMTRLVGFEAYPELTQVLDLYRTQNPDFPTDDGGMVIQDCLDHLRKEGGPDGVHAVAFAKVDHTNPDEVKAAIAIFGAVWVGVNVQQANMDQFDRMQPWDYVDGSPDDGGHSVLVGGYDGDGQGGDERFITWATETAFTDGYWGRQVEEAWVVVWPEHLGTAQFLQGVDQTALAEAFQSLTGQALPGNGDGPVTPPAPEPPSPGPAVDDADRALAGAVTDWVQNHRHSGEAADVSQALRLWLRSKALAAV